MQRVGANGEVAYGHAGGEIGRSGGINCNRAGTWKGDEVGSVAGGGRLGAGPTIAGFPFAIAVDVTVGLRTGGSGERKAEYDSGEEASERGV